MTGARRAASLGMACDIMIPNLGFGCYLPMRRLIANNQAICRLAVTTHLVHTASLVFFCLMISLAPGQLPVRHIQDSAELRLVKRNRSGGLTISKERFVESAHDAHMRELFHSYMMLK